MVLLLGEKIVGTIIKNMYNEVWEILMSDDNEMYPVHENDITLLSIDRLKEIMK